MKRLLFGIFLIVVCSCSKDVPTSYNCNSNLVSNYFYDTLASSDYVMLYKGSWWQYSNGTIDTCTLISYPQREVVEVECTLVTENFFITPKTQKLGPMKGSSALYTTSSSSNNTTPTLEYPLISNSNGIIYEKSYGVGSGTASGTVHLTVTSNGHHDSIKINNTTFYDVYESRLTEYTDYWHSGSGTAPGFGGHYYFAKDIGLVAYQRLYGGVPVTTDTISLVNYYIAPH